VAHNLKVKDADGVNRRVVSIDTDVGGTGDEVHLPIQGVVTAPYRVLGIELLNVTSGAGVALGSSLGSIPTGSRSALITVEPEGDIRFREDGTAPAATPSTNANAGHRIAAGGALEVAPMDSSGVAQLGNVRLRAVSTTVNVIVTYRAPRVAD
jgi:hypothetical protein